MILNRDRLHTELILEEQLRLIAYDDATGKPVPAGGVCRGNLTVGVGHNLDACPLTPAQLAYIGHDGRTQPITHAQAIQLLDDDINCSTLALGRAMPWWLQLDEIRARVMVDLIFNMGIGHLLHFPNFLSHMRGADFSAAADDLKDSLWYQQVGSRAVRLVAMVATGEDFTS